MRVIRLTTNNNRKVIGLLHSESDSYYEIQVMKIENPYMSDWKENEKIKISKSLILKVE